MNPRTLEQNGVSLTSVVEKIKRGDAKDSLFAAFLPTEENFDKWVKFYGIKNVIAWLSSQVRKDAQASLDYVLGEKGWKTRTVTNPETKKDEEVYYYDEESLDEDKYYQVLISGVARGGVTMKDLLEDLKEINTEMAGLAVQIATGDPSVGTRLMELGQQWQNLNAAIDAKKRERKPKAIAEAVAA